MDRQSQQAPFYPQNQMTRCVISPPLSRRTLAQRARRERERDALRSPLVRQRASQQLLREHNHSYSSVSSQMDVEINGLFADRNREHSSGQFLEGSTSKNASYNTPQRATHQILREQQYNHSSVSSQMDAQINAVFGDQTQESRQYKSSSFHFSEGSTSENAPRKRPFHGILTDEIRDTFQYEKDFQLVPPQDLDLPIAPILHLPEERHFLGPMNVVCKYCSALHWVDERLSNSTSTTSRFGMCCLQGKIRLPLLAPLPSSFRSLYEDSTPLATSFRKNIRSYNASNAFTSLGVTMDDRILHGQGPTSFTIHGELHHRIGSLLPEPGTQPSYAQLYIYDASAALSYRHNRNPHLRPDVLTIINRTLLECNYLCRLYKHAYEVLAENNLPNTDVPVSLHYTPGTDPRRYNLPTANEIAVILPGEGSNMHTTRDIVMHLRAGPLQRISECHPAYWPSHYVLLFPQGELGWHPGMKHWDVKNNCSTQQRLTQLEYSAYRLFERTTEYSPILRGGPLFQEFVVDSWAAYEQNRLHYVRDNQEKIRSNCYKGLLDSMGDGLNASQIGNRLILPSSHPGSPRNMYEIYQDSMAITRYNHHPDIFLTATANPRWPEIRNELKPHQNVLDRPDLVARVFELKRKAIMKEIIEKGIFGKVAAYVYTIEFQKRGLPHMHALIFLEHQDKIRTAAQVDKIVCAELPDPMTNPTLFSTISRCMIHGPCGSRNPESPCMVNDNGHPHCKSKYPRAFVNKTSMDRDGYPLYKREDTGQKYRVGEHEIDNRDVVPYNPHLSTMFDCHINVEVCASVRAVKYIHKYIYKGYDLTTLVVGHCNDEIQQYLDSRYIGPVEAAWHLFENPMHKESPHVERLPLHLKGMHQVSFNTRDTPAQIESNAARQKSKLTAFFAYYKANPTAAKYTYPEFPQHFVWKKDKENSRWEPRQRGFAIGRVYFAKPNEGERFYLRLLLTVVPGPSSFKSLKQVGSTRYLTYKDACIARGLLQNDYEWDVCLQEASIIRTGYQLRRLFSILLTECSPLHPDQLWQKYSLQICDDLSHKLEQVFGIKDASTDQIQDYGLYLLNNLLFESGKTLSDFPPMPLPRETWCYELGNRLICEQLQHRFLVSEEEVAASISRLNVEQLHMYNVVTTSVHNKEGKMYFLNGAAGTGKTYVYNTIAAACRHQGHIVIMVASSGIASLLLHGGRTAHSTFKLPLDVFDNSICSFTKQSLHADLFRNTDLIIWDEVATQHRHCIEAVDRTLQDIRGNTKPFGGITVVLGGDFCQTLPVITKGVREEVVDASVSRSCLWKNIEVLNLIQNMRLHMDLPQNIQFAEFLTKVGRTPTDCLQLPSDVYKCGSISELLSSVYPALNVYGTATSAYLKDRTILAPRNDEVRQINDVALKKFPGEYIEYLGADKAIEQDSDQPHIVPSYSTDILNGFDPSCLPPFRLRLKVGSPIMLLRNIAPRDGLCNGTRLIVEHCATRVIEARILTGDKAGDTVFIPRITLSPSSAELPIPMSRRQFPVRLAFAMTINKSQGQSVKYVGIDLETPVFSHGQLYVALSRCTSSNNISIILPPNSSESTINIVYPEVLLS